jgi:hypothetical protein
MAHGDYNCCLICDRKMEYNPYEASTKESPCIDCIEKMRNSGMVVLSVEEMKKAVDEKGDDAIKWLHEIGYEHCYYDNHIDSYLEEKGLILSGQEDGKWGKKLKPLEDN